MRSIRLSLVVYFLALLAIALGAASWLAYRTSDETLSQKKEATRQLIQAQYEENCRQERSRLDDQLLAEAKSLARQTQTMLDFSRLHDREHQLGLLARRLADGPQRPPDRPGLDRRGGAQPGSAARPGIVSRPQPLLRGAVPHHRPRNPFRYVVAGPAGDPGIDRRVLPDQQRLGRLVPFQVDGRPLLPDRPEGVRRRPGAVVGVGRRLYGAGPPGAPRRAAHLRPDLPADHSSRTIRGPRRPRASAGLPATLRHLRPVRRLHRRPRRRPAERRRRPRPEPRRRRSGNGRLAGRPAQPPVAHGRPDLRRRRPGLLRSGAPWPVAVAPRVRRRQPRLGKRLPPPGGPAPDAERTQADRPARLRDVGDAQTGL